MLFADIVAMALEAKQKQEDAERADLAALSRSERVARLNDAYRQAPSSSAGKVVLTPGVRTLGRDAVAAILRAATTFDTFTPDNDPHGEHDFGAVEHDGERYFWKIDYYGRDLTLASPDPTNPDVTVRVMTIMRADEY